MSLHFILNRFYLNVFTCGVFLYINKLAKLSFSNVGEDHRVKHDICKSSCYVSRELLRAVCNSRTRFVHASARGMENYGDVNNRR